MKPYYGATNDEGKWWNGSEWKRHAAPRNLNEARNETLEVFETMRMHDVYNTHPDGCFKCARCWKMHFVPDNFELLCDGCVNILMNEYPNVSQAIKDNILAWKERAKTWYSGDHSDQEMKDRFTLREASKEIFK